MRKKEGVIFLNGDPPARKIIKRYLKKKSTVIGADGACNYLIKMSITPDVIIGDMDSIKPAVMKKLEKKGSEVLKIVNQEMTDFEKCIRYSISNNFEKIFVFGGASPRADHTINNYSILKKYYKKIDITAIDDIFEIFFVKDNVEFSYRKGALLSIIGLSKATGVMTKGLEYLLKGETLEFGVREGTLNKAVRNKVSISFDKGNLLLFKKHFIK